MLKNRAKTIRLFILFAIAILLLVFLLNVYMFFFKKTGQSYGITTRNWSEYHVLENWNMPGIVRMDLDGDNLMDAVTFENCAIISSVPESAIPSERRCNEPFVFPRAYAGENNEDTIGYQLTKPEDYRHQWLKQSFLVKTKEDTWRFYEFNGLQIKAFELQDTGLFQPINTTLADYIDALFFQLSHSFIVPLLLLASQR